MSLRQTADDRADTGELSSALRGNIEALRERRKQEKRNASREEKLADTITAQIRSLVLHRYGPTSSDWKRKFG